MTDLQKLIAAKWFLPLETLAKRSGVCFAHIQRALHGEEICEWSEKDLRKYLKNYYGEEL